MAACYPGIPGDYRQWPERIKRAWLANVGYVTAWLDVERGRVDRSTPGGMRNAIIELTGSKEAADKAEGDLKMAAKAAEVLASGGSGFAESE